jgi:hypothetical protein
VHNLDVQAMQPSQAHHNVDADLELAVRRDRLTVRESKNNNNSNLKAKEEKAANKNAKCKMQNK